MTELAYLSLGSNIEPERNLPAAVALLAQYGRVTAVSSAWRSPALGDPDGPDFLNAAVILDTALSAAELKAGPIAEIEAALGRVRGPNKNAPRTIDIDIMLFGSHVLDVAGHHIPSPEIYERAFVAVPLAEIAPGLVHPATGETLSQIAARFSADNLERVESVRLA